MAIRSAKDLAKRFGWEAWEITVTSPTGEIVDIVKNPEEIEPTSQGDISR